MQNSVDAEDSVEITVFLGAPGSGKGTQAKKLSQHPHFIHLSTGDILRKAIRENTALGREARGFMDKGELVPDSTMIALIQETLSNIGQDKHVILDGFPRTVAQADALNANPATQVGQAVLFDIPDEELVERLTGRRVCKQCGHPFHVKHIPPQKEGVCDFCGGEVIQRVDDDVSVIKRRLEIFHTQNQGLIDYYRNKNNLKKVDVRHSAEKVEKLLSEFLK